MHSVVYKARLPINGAVAIEMPVSAQLLHVDEQFGELVMWYRCVSGRVTKTEFRHIETYGTGIQIEDHKPGGKLLFIGTAKMAGGTLIMHVFERISLES